MNGALGRSEIAIEYRQWGSVQMLEQTNAEMISCIHYIYKDWICIIHTLDMYNIYTLDDMYIVQLYIALYIYVKKTRIITKLLHSYE